MQSLYQTRPYFRQEFEISDGKLKVLQEAPFLKECIEIPFEEIAGNKLIPREEFNRNLVTFSTLLFVVLCAKLYFQIFGDKQDYGVTVFVLCLFCFFSFLVYFTRKKSLVLVASTKRVEFFEESPDKATVHTFIQELQAQSKKYLLYKYAKMDERIPPEEQLEQVNWLRDRNVITPQEHQQLAALYSKEYSLSIPEAGKA